MISSIFKLAARYKFALWGFAVTAAYWPGIFSASTLLRWVSIGIGVPLLVPIDWRKLDWLLRFALVAFFVACLASLIISPDPRGGGLELFLFVLFGGALIAGSQIESPDHVLSGMIFGLLPSAIVCIPQFFGWQAIPQSVGPAGFFYNREVVAETAAPLFIWSVVSGRWWGFAITGVPLLVGESRIACIAASLALVCVWKPKRHSIKYLAIGLLVIASVLAVFVLGLPKLTSAGTRMVIWGATAMAITPWGNGLGWFTAAHPYEQFAHSDVLQALAELGLGSLPLFVIGSWAVMRGNGDRATRAAFFVVGLEALVSFPLHVPVAGFTAALLAGHLARRRAAVPDFRWHRRVADGVGVQRRGAVALPLD